MDQVQTPEGIATVSGEVIGTVAGSWAGTETKIKFGEKWKACRLKQGEMSFEDRKRYSAWSKLREEGLSYEQSEQIKFIDKGQKPVLEIYLKNDYIENHLRSFKDSGAVKIMPI